jgi:CHAT domain-containing protein
VARHLARRAAGRQDLADRVQQVLLKLFEDDAATLRRWDPTRGSLSAYLGAVVDHTMISELRRPAQPEPTEAPDDARSPDSGPENKAAFQSLMGALVEELGEEDFEVLLVYHPLADGWLGIAWTGSGVVAKRLGPIDPTAAPAALATALLEPFRDRLAAAQRVSVLADRALAAVAFHALPWDGGVLLDHAPVIYAVDPPEPRPRTCARSPAALIVADARLDLAAASAAARPLEAALRARGYEVRRLQGDEARLDAVRAALIDPCVALFHYEGHAVFEGRDGVDAALILADGRLTAADVLALPRVPEAAVLSGCSTAAADGLGLAHAFLAQGAIEVLATSGPVDDATAARVGRLLYERARPGDDEPRPRLAEAWRRVSANLRGEIAPPKDLDAYRVLGF